MNPDEIIIAFNCKLIGVADSNLMCYATTTATNRVCHDSHTLMQSQNWLQHAITLLNAATAYDSGHQALIPGIGERANRCYYLDKNVQDNVEQLLEDQ